MYCTKCKEESGEEKFCNTCGTPLVKRCSQCGELLPADASFCPECGKKIEESEVVIKEPIERINVYETEKSHDTKEKFSVKKKFLYSFGITSVIIFVIITVWVFQKSNKEEPVYEISPNSSTEKQQENDKKKNSKKESKKLLDAISNHIQILEGTLEFREGQSYLILPEAISLNAYGADFITEYRIAHVKEILLIENETGKPAFTDLEDGADIKAGGAIVVENNVPTLFIMDYVNESDEGAVSQENPSSEISNSKKENAGTESSSKQNSGNSIKEQEKKHVADVEEQASKIEEAIEVATTQAEWNEYSGQLYSLWDGELNRLWGVLKKNLEDSVMNDLLQKQREWIKSKEKAIEEAGNLVAGGSAETMNRNIEGADLTRKRVYELLEYLPE